MGILVDLSSDMLTTVMAVLSAMYITVFLSLKENGNMMCHMLGSTRGKKVIQLGFWMRVLVIVMKSTGVLVSYTCFAHSLRCQSG